MGFSVCLEPKNTPSYCNARQGTRVFGRLSDFSPFRRNYNKPRVSPEKVASEKNSTHFALYNPICGAWPASIIDAEIVYYNIMSSSCSGICCWVSGC
uniref:Ovule protein n=1 Tax=Bursaphelenchus xylophilus TaxID=6326 RepID=A0A1I7RN53_BURXY